MSTVKQIIYKIKERHSAFNVTDDYPVINELIYSFMNDVRETLIREEYINTRKINKQYYQFICCNEIECVDETCTYNGTEVSKTLDMFRVKLPQLVTRVDDLDLKYVGDKSGVNGFDRFEWGRFATLNSRMFTKYSHAYSIIGNNLFLRNLYTKGQKFVCLLALLRDPVKACDWDDDNYPVPSEKKLIDLVLLSMQTSTKVTDVLNNAADDLMQPKINQQAVAEQQQSIRQDEPQQRNRRS